MGKIEQTAIGQPSGHPKGLYYLSFTEMWERFSFYGMSALLTLYMVKELLQPENAAQVIGLAALRNMFEFRGPMSDVAFSAIIYGWYAGLVYFTPIIGGWVALWRPMEIFLYDWWPLAARIRLLDRLARMSTRLVQRRRRSAPAATEQAD